MIRFINQFALPVLLPVVSAVAAAFGGATTGTTRGIWITLGIVAVAGTAILGVIKARQAERAKEHQMQLADVAAKAKAKLATALSAAGNPLIVELAELTTLTGNACKEKLAALIFKATAVAANQCSGNAADRTRVRAVFYQFKGPGFNRLDLVKSQGRDGDVPAQFFDKARDDYSASVVRTAAGRNTVRYPNLTVQAPGGFEPSGRTYKSFVAVPVVAGDEKIGLLAVDSDEVDIFSDVEEGYLRLLSGLLAAGVSHSRLSVTGREAT